MKALFIHINKCGGTSVKQVIGESSVQKYKHEAIKDILPRINPDNFFKFSFIRNPYDRIASMYFYRKNNLQRVKLKDVGFEEWFYNAFTIPNYTSVQLMNASCWDYLSVDGKLAVDYVGKVENMEQDWKYVAEILGVSDKLPKRNPTRYKKPVTYTEEMKGIVERKFKWDLEQY